MLIIKYHLPTENAESDALSLATNSAFRWLISALPVSVSSFNRSAQNSGIYL